MNHTMRGFAWVSVAALLLTSCKTIERETGLNLDTQRGALAGATFGGVVAAIAGANPAWIAASVVLGGVAGGAIGNSLGKDNAEKHARTNLHALDTLGQGQSENWSDNKSGNSGSTRVTAVNRKADGSVCKTYVETVRVGSQTTTRDATACKVAGGTWKVSA